MSDFLFDESVPLASVQRLRREGHDVSRAISGETDRAVLERARTEQRLVVTFDRDFGFLVFRGGALAPRGIVYFRSGPASPEGPAAQLLALLETPASCSRASSRSWNPRASAIAQTLRRVVKRAELRVLR